MPVKTATARVRSVRRGKKNGGHRRPGVKKLSPLKKPAEMSLDEWQTELRRQFGAEQEFDLKNVGSHEFFSEFHVANPKSKTNYRVAIRGTAPGVNYCSCPDFATNALGTCKHVEFTLAALARKRGGKTALRSGFHPAYSEIYLEYGAERTARFRPGTACSVELARLATGYFDDDGRLRGDAFERFDQFLSATNPLEDDLRVYEDALALVAQVRDAAKRRTILAKAFPKGVHSAAFKKLLRVPLYEYQREGALFAARAGRSLIGDEMGLGKTIQAIAACEIMARHFGVERVLIICPTSLKHQWQREIERFTDRSTIVIGGLQPMRQERYAEPSFYKIANYDTIHRDLDLIAGWSPDVVILDEAQRIKNWQTRAARSVKKIASPHAIVLTGTPLENRLEELVSIVQFVDQHRLGPTFRFLHEHQVREEKTGRVIGYRELDRVGKTLAPILLRRRKDEVLKQLPPRLEKRFFVPMTPQQQVMHDENKEIVAKIVHKWRRYHFLSEADQRRLMIALQNMRMSCNSTYLLDKETDHGTKADELATLLEEIYERPDSKVVIFSQWVLMHELVERRMKQRGWNYVLFHGGVDGEKRKGLIDRFREEPRCRAFLSTDAGGVGLNLQHASAVVNMDLPWNPAVLEQRIGRVHRLGQTQPVQVVNFVAQGTIEEGMLSVLKFKQSMFAGILDGGEKEVFLGGSRLDRFMKTVDETTSGIPQAEVNGDDRDPNADAVSESFAGAAPRQSRSPQRLGTAMEVAAPIEVSRETPRTIPSSLEGLLQGGLALLQQLVESTHGDANRGGELPRRLGTVEVVRDEPSGEAFLKLPMPRPEAIQQVLSGLAALLDGWR